MNQAEKYKGSCFCGKVVLEVTGPPPAAAYCHCQSCRKWHAAPINAWAIWPDDAVEFIEGREHLISFTLNQEGEISNRLTCKVCGGGVANIKPAISMTVVYPMTLDGSDYVFSPTMHIHYSERALDFNDGLPKFSDLPEELGGSGNTVEEPAVSGPRST